MKKGVEQVSVEQSTPRKPDNRTFLLVAGGLGGLIAVALMCLGGYYMLCVNQGLCGGNEPEVDVVPTTVTQTSITPLTATFTDTPPTPPTITLTTPSPSNTPPHTLTYTPTFTATYTPSITPTQREIYFDEFPPEYHVIQPPPRIIEILDGDGYAIPLPGNPGPLQKELTLAARDYGLSRFDFSRIVNYSIESDNEYVAVPVSQSYFKENYGVSQDFTKGVLVGLIYDKNGAYTGVSDVYEVWAYENHVYLSGTKFKNAILLQQIYDEYDWVPQDSSQDLPLLAFVKNGCWLCWRVDGRCGCLICRSRR